MADIGSGLPGSKPESEIGSSSEPEIGEGFDPEHDSQTTTSIWFTLFCFTLLVVWAWPHIYQVLAKYLPSTSAKTGSERDREAFRVAALARMTAVHDIAVQKAVEKADERRAAQAEEDEKMLALQSSIPGQGHRVGDSPALPVARTPMAVPLRQGAAASGTEPVAGVWTRTAANEKKAAEAALIARRMEVAKERLLPEPSDTDVPVVTVVFRVHGWTGEVRTERRFREDAPLHAVLDAVHALCPGGLTGCALATVIPRALVSSWTDYDLSTAPGAVEVERMRDRWREEWADADAGQRSVLCAPTALPAARITLASAGLRDRISLVVRSIEADRVHPSAMPS